MTAEPDDRLVERTLGARSGPVVVVGDLLLDRWVSGTADRLSREAPAAIVTVQDRVDVPGGAANAAVNLAALGARVRLVGAVGRDEAGDSLLRLLSAAGVDVSAVVRLDGPPTVVKTRISAAGQVLLRVDEEQPLTSLGGRLVAEGVAGAVDGAAAVLVCDYGLGAAGPAVREVLAAASLPDPFVVDAHDLRPWADLRPAAVTPNAAETAGLLGRPLGADRARDAIDSAGALHAATGAAGVVVTLDRDGTVALGPSGTGRTFARPAPDSMANGAGDTFVAALTFALTAGLDLPSAARVGQLAADVVTRSAGTAVCTAAQLRASLTDGARLLDEQALVDALAAERTAGRRIVFTNGCFDVLHRGHTAYLKQARALGDLLVVAVNDDDSTRRLKGPGRPVNLAADRAGVVAELACVDYVTVFSADTPAHLLRLVQPDVYAKGGDYTPEMLEETPVVEAYGGQVRIVDYVSPHSTSDLIERLRRA